MRKVFRAAMLVSLLAAGACGCTSVQVAGKTGRSDVDTLLAMVQQAMKSDIKVTVKHAGADRPYRDTGELQRRGEEISGLLGLVSTGRMEATAAALPVFRSQGEAPGARARVALTLTGSKGRDSSYLVLKLETGDKWDPAALAAWQSDAGEKLRGLGIQEAWNVMAQGIVNPSFADKKSGPEGIIERIKKGMNAKAVERYTDSGTLSVSFDSEKLGASIMSGGHRVSLQAAVHRITETGEWRLTLGTPLITSEY